MMKIALHPLPYKEDALKPALSERAVHIHYHGHHQKYVEKLNVQLERIKPVTGGPNSGRVLQYENLEEIILNGDQNLYNLAAQVWNHSFYWECLSPYNDISMSPKFFAAVENQFGGMEAFYRKFFETAVATFGSGWTWLVKDKYESLRIINTHDGDNPLSQNLHPLLAIDMWEHAYYLDYPGRDREYLYRILRRVHWEFVSQNLETPFLDCLQSRSGKNLVRLLN